MRDLVLYIHGKGGCAEECEHYRSLFPDCDVKGLDYQTFSPWETGKEICEAVEKQKDCYRDIILIANSIGAFFSMNAGITDYIKQAYFISPVVDMERLICDMMGWANVTEEDLKAEGIIHTAFGEDLSWEYLSYVREHPIVWNVPTRILYGANDNLTTLETISGFAGKHAADLIVMENGEHWFHTEEQMQFLDDWIRTNRQPDMKSLLIKDTTKEERIRIVTQGLSQCGGACDFCNGCDNLGGGRVDAFYEPYINGEKELRELNMDYSNSCRVVR